MVHLVYCDDAGKKGEHVLDKMLLGEKTMVVRGAAGRKIPHSRVQDGETLYFMEKGTAEISACAKVVAVHNHTKLTDSEITGTLQQHQHKLCLTDKQKQRWHKKCLCLVEFDSVQSLDPPLAFEHQITMDDWLILDKTEDVVVGSSVPYSYEKTRL